VRIRTFLLGLCLLTVSLVAAHLVGEPEPKSRICIALWFVGAEAITGFLGVVACVLAFCAEDLE